MFLGVAITLSNCQYNYQKANATQAQLNYVSPYSSGVIHTSYHNDQSEEEYDNDDDHGDHDHDNELEPWDIRHSVPGEPDQDYPRHAFVPQTNFTCDGRAGGTTIFHSK